jgi:hypothetical protein
MPGSIDPVDRSRWSMMHLVQTNGVGEDSLFDEQIAVPLTCPTFARQDQDQAPAVIEDMEGP